MPPWILLRCGSRLSLALSLYANLLSFVSAAVLIAADSRDRSRNPRFAKPLLYQLSYVGVKLRLQQRHPVPPACTVLHLSA